MREVVTNFCTPVQNWRVNGDRGYDSRGCAASQGWARGLSVGDLGGSHPTPPPPQSMTACSHRPLIAHAPSTDATPFRRFRREALDCRRRQRY